MNISANIIATLFKQNDSIIIRAVMVLVIAILGSLIALVVSRITANLLARSGNKTLSRFIQQFIFYLLMILVICMVLAKLGVPTSSMVAVLAGMSVAVGLSLRSSLSNLASGILLVMFRPFRINDTITIDSLTGKVVMIELIFTDLLDDNGNTISIPNNKFMTNAIVKQKAAA